MKLALTLAITAIRGALAGLVAGTVIQDSLNADIQDSTGNDVEGIT